MPLVSQAQRRFMHAKHPQLAKEFEAHTPKGVKLPEHAAKGKPGAFRSLSRKLASRKRKKGVAK